MPDQRQQNKTAALWPDHHLLPSPDPPTSLPVITETFLSSLPASPQASPLIPAECVECWLAEAEEPGQPEASGEEMNNINKQGHLNAHSGMESVAFAHRHAGGGGAGMHQTSAAHLERPPRPDVAVHLD